MANVYKALEQARRVDGPAAKAGAAGVVAADGRLRFGREMRQLSARLQPLADERGSIVLLFTACGRGEGTTTVSWELAQHLAAEGRRVLFCAPLGGQAWAGANGDARPVVAGPLDTLHQADISDLRRDSSGVSGNIAFRAWLEQQRANFDFILIDGPPLLAQQSWSTMLKVPDGIILVLEAEKTRSMLVTSTVSMIEEAGGHILGLVFNKRRQYVPRFLYKWL